MFINLPIALGVGVGMALSTTPSALEATSIVVSAIVLGIIFVTVPFFIASWIKKGKAFNFVRGFVTISLKIFLAYLVFFGSGMFFIFLVEKLKGLK
jgi:glucan phosphoethanolaminetransferase (alkaline phosphatase superfamily)